MTAIADRGMVRKDAGNRGTTLLPDADIDAVIIETDNLVKFETKKYDWIDTDADYNIVKRISELLASSDIRHRFKDNDKIADKQYDEAMNLLESVLTNSPALAATGTVTIRRRAYRTYPLNLSADSFHSITPPRGSLREGSEAFV